MSEGSGAQSASRLSDQQFNKNAGVAFIVIGLMGPVLVLLAPVLAGIFASIGLPAFAIKGNSGGIADAVRLGWFTLPMVAFGLVALFVHIKNPQDYYGGAVLAAVALFAVWASNDLPGMRGFAFGPGTAPRLFAYALFGLSVAIAAIGLFTDGPPRGDYSFSGPLFGAIMILALIPITYYSNRIGRSIPGIPPDVVVAALGAAVVLILAFLLMRIAPRGPVFITASTLIFAITVRPLGLVFASFVSLVVSSMATEEGSWIETIIWSAVLTTFCSLLFPWGLNLPLQLWPRF